jgi:transcriptional regulator with XRE-family HTH domain
VDTDELDQRASRRLATAVERERHQRKWTQADLATSSGLSLTTIQSIEAGRAGRPRKRTARGLEQVFEWATGSVERILEGATTGVSGKSDEALRWTSLAEFIRVNAENDEAAERIAKEVDRYLDESGRPRDDLIDELNTSEIRAGGRIGLRSLDAAIGMPGGYLAAIGRGAELVVAEGPPSVLMSESGGANGDYPWQSADRLWITSADELAISASGLRPETQEFIARTISRMRARVHGAIDDERDQMILEFRAGEES